MKYDVLDKLIKLRALTLAQASSKVKINRDITEELIVKGGVKQGDPLSAALYSLVIDKILKQKELRGNITSRLQQRTAYADDILLTTRINRFQTFAVF